MASKFRKPLSAATKATLRRKAKASKRYTYGTLAKVYRRGQGAFYRLVVEEFLWRRGVWAECTRFFVAQESMI